jgi:hypothetical protein
MHLSEGEIRAFQDLELDASRRAQVEKHLASCEPCRELAETLLRRAQKVSDRLSNLQPDLDQVSQPAAARARLAESLANQRPVEPMPGFDNSQIHKESINMSKHWFSRVDRRAWVALAVVLLLAVSLAFPSVQAIANSFLGLFRVQHISVVQVDSDWVNTQLGNNPQFESLFSQDVQFQETGKSQQVGSAEEAAAIVGYPVRLPTAAGNYSKLEIQSGAQATIRVDVQHARALLEVIGRSDIQLPDSLDGTTVTVDIPTGVAAQYGYCSYTPEQSREGRYDPDATAPPSTAGCTSLIQGPSPTVSAPPGLDIAQLGEAYLQLLGMDTSQAAQFASNIDWTSTFVVPIPSEGTSYREVPVDGVTGTLILQNRSTGRSSTQYVLLWVKDGIIYALTGTGDGSRAVEIADSLQ